MSETPQGSAPRYGFGVRVACILLAFVPIFGHAAEKPSQRKKSAGGENSLVSPTTYPAASSDALLCPLLIRSEISEGAREILLKALEQGYGPGTNSSNNAPAGSQPYVVDYLSKPLLSSGMDFKAATSNLNNSATIGVASVQLERLKDTAGMVQFATQLANWVNDDDKKDFLKLLEILNGHKDALASAFNEATARKSGINTSSVVGSSSTPTLQLLADAQAKGLPPPPRQTQVKANSQITSFIQGRGEFFASANKQFGNMDKRELFAMFDRLDASGIGRLVQQYETQLNGLASSASMAANVARQNATMSAQIAATGKDPNNSAIGISKEGRSTFAKNAAIANQAVQEFDDAARQFKNSIPPLRQALAEYFQIYRSAEVPSGTADSGWSEQMKRLQDSPVHPFKEVDEAAAAARSKAIQQGGSSYGIQPGPRRQGLLNHQRRRGYDAQIRFVSARIGGDAPLIVAADRTTKPVESNQWDSVTDNAVAAIRTGQYREAMAFSDRAVAMRPDEWQGYFLRFLSAVHSRRWSSATDNLLDALKHGFSPDVHPASTQLLLEQIAALESDDPKVKRPLEELDAQVRIGTLKSAAVTEILQTRTQGVKREEELIARLVATSPKTQANALMFPKGAPLVQAWGTEEFNGSPIKASFLRKLSARGVKVIAVPRDDTEWALVSRQKEVAAWADGGTDSKWKLAWVADLAADTDPEGHGLLREAEFRWHQSNPTSGRIPQPTELVTTIGSMAGETAIVLEAPSKQLEFWQARRRDVLRQTITAELKAAPNSTVLWGALVNHGWIQMPPGFQGHHQSFCIQAAIYLANDFRAPAAYGSALLALKQNLKLVKSDEDWIRDNLTSIADRPANSLKQ